MTIKNFEDLPVWQKSRMLSKRIYEITSNSAFKDFSLRDQMRRSAVSAVSNIAEGFERGSNKEFIQFLFITKGSLGELRTQLYLSYDNRYITDGEFKELENQCRNLSKEISNFISYLKQSNITKLKHKEK